MEALADRIGKRPAGTRLLGLLRSRPDAGTVAKAVLAVLNENDPSGGTAAEPWHGTLAAPPRVALGDALTLISAQQCIQPRGKFDVGLFADRLVVATPKHDVAVPYAAIRAIAVLDALPKDTKGRVLLYLHLDGSAGVMNGKTALSSLLLQTTATALMDISNPLAAGRLQGPAAVVLCQVLGLLGVLPSAFCSPSPDVFRSAGRHGGITANVKVSTGTLFPMATALCFVEKPAVFLPLAGIQCVEFGRAGGSSATFDFFVHSKDGSAVEFGQISKEELPALSAYVADQRLRVGRGEDDVEGEGDDEDSGRQGAGVGASSAGPADSEGSDEDSDFAPTIGSDSDGDGGGSNDDAVQERGGGSRGTSSSEEDSGGSSVECSEDDMSDMEQEEMAASAAQLTSKRRRT